MLVIEGGGVEWDDERAANAIVEKLKVKVEFAGLCRLCVSGSRGRARIYLSRPKEISDDTRGRSTRAGRWKVGRDTGTKVSRFVIE